MRRSGVKPSGMGRTSAGTRGGRALAPARVIPHARGRRYRAVGANLASDWRTIGFWETANYRRPFEDGRRVYCHPVTQEVRYPTNNQIRAGACVFWSSWMTALAGCPVR